MATVKYRVREFTPKAGQPGSHSFYAEAVTDNTITNAELARKVEARGIGRAYMVRAVLEAVAEIILEETQENNRVQIETGDGTAFVSIYPRATGSVTDVAIESETTAAHAQDASVAVRTRAAESDLTPDRIQWSLGASVGIKFSKQFSLMKSAKKVAYNAQQTASEPADTGNTSSGGTSGGTTSGGDTGTGNELGG